jgi:hypothetical protein
MGARAPHPYSRLYGRAALSCRLPADVPVASPKQVGRHDLLEEPDLSDAYIEMSSFDIENSLAVSERYTHESETALRYDHF